MVRYCMNIRARRVPQISVIPCHTAYRHIQLCKCAKGNFFKTSPSSNLQSELTLYRISSSFDGIIPVGAKPRYSHPLSGVADPTGNGL